MKRIHVLLIILVFVSVVFVVDKFICPLRVLLSRHPRSHSARLSQTYRQTVANSSNRIASAVDARLKPYFDKLKINYPPPQITLIALKQEKTLELWAFANNRNILIKKYPILAVSGKPGPKLKDDDEQVPEGIYRITSLASQSIRVDYPNAYDQTKVKSDKRSNSGKDVFYTGMHRYAGAMAINDESMAELSVLIPKVSLPKTKVIVAPNDLRHSAPAVKQSGIKWLSELYGIIQKEMLNYR